MRDILKRNEILPRNNLQRKFRVVTANKGKLVWRWKWWEIWSWATVASDLCLFEGNERRLRETCRDEKAKVGELMIEFKTMSGVRSGKDIRWDCLPCTAQHLDASSRFRMLNCLTYTTMYLGNSSCWDVRREVEERMSGPCQGLFLVDHLQAASQTPKVLAGSAWSESTWNTQAWGWHDGGEICGRLQALEVMMRSSDRARRGSWGDLFL